MSDEPSDGQKSAGRDASGRFAAGNPGGGRPRLPEWFRSKGEDSLRVLCEIMDGEREDKRMSPGQAAQIVKESVYGKAPMTPEDADDAINALGEVLSRLRAGQEPKT